MQIPCVWSIGADAAYFFRLEQSFGGPDYGLVTAELIVTGEFAGVQSVATTP